MWPAVPQPWHICRHVAATAVCCQVQRGLAIASQTLASELSIKCERLQARLEPHAPAGANGAALHHPPPTPMATPSGDTAAGAAAASRDCEARFGR